MSDSKAGELVDLFYTKSSKKRHFIKRNINKKLIKKRLINRTYNIRIPKKASGSITVEASFVMPIVILTIFALIYLSFYLHDINRIQGAVDLTIHKAGFTVKHSSEIETGKVLYDDINNRGVFYLLFGNNTDAEKQIHSILEQKLSKGLFLVKIKNISVEVYKARVEVSIKTATEVNLPVFSYLFQALSDKELKGEYPVHNPAEAIRYTEVILDTGSEINGMKELKEMLENLLSTKK